jgi:hypothetical protein
MTSVIKYYEGIDSVAVIGNYLPRQCGIATFTTKWGRTGATYRYLLYKPKNEVDFLP